MNMYTILGTRRSLNTSTTAKNDKIDALLAEVIEIELEAFTLEGKAKRLYATARRKERQAGKLLRELQGVDPRLEALV